jgi:branched-chain amino acid transport system ATP-binding protein
MRGDLTAMRPLLKVSGLNAWYGRAHILFDVDLEVRRGEVVALMGRNGAGKSTTLKAIMGLIAAKRGTIEFDGRAIERLQPFEIARAGIGFVPEDRRIFTELTVRENLEVGRRPARPDAPVWTVDKLFELFPNLREMPDRLGGRMSGGEQQMLTVARTLMGNPRLLLLDEPSEGVAPLIVEKMAAVIVALKAQGLSVLLSEQNLPFAAAVCDRVYVLEKGQVRFTGTMDELAADEAVRRQYLTV